MTQDNQKSTETEEQKPGKISLQEAMRRKLEQKKQEQASGKTFMNGKPGNQLMKSQQTKKPNNQRRRTGV